MVTTALVSACSVETPWGWARLEATEAGLFRLSWPWRSPGVERWRGAAGDLHLEMAAAALKAYFAGDWHMMTELSIDSRNFTPWQRKVYRYLCTVPFGELVSYGEVARGCGSLAGARAVGLALARNPLPLFIPCHRVIRGDGSPGGYTLQGDAGKGVELKKQLIIWERELSQGVAIGG